jgi:FKBP-type peptidyl-prolyl cis-trans isomerase FklB
VPDQASYSIGLNIGRNFKKQQVPINAAIFLQGLRDGLSGAKPALTEQEMNASLQALEAEVAVAVEAHNKKLAESNKTEGAAFLAANQKKAGVQTTASGLQYQVIKEGNGPIPKKTDMVSTHYRGTLLDGTEFDSSYARNEPTSFPVDQVIAGWTEALQLMKVGSKWKLFVPSELAYRDQGAGADIGPNATLVFEIELLGIENPPKPVERIQP